MALNARKIEEENNNPAPSTLVLKEGDKKNVDQTAVVRTTKIWLYLPKRIYENNITKKYKDLFSVNIFSLISFFSSDAVWSVSFSGLRWSVRN